MSTSPQIGTSQTDDQVKWICSCTKGGCCYPVCGVCVNPCKSIRVCLCGTCYLENLACSILCGSCFEYGCVPWPLCEFRDGPSAKNKNVKYGCYGCVPCCCVSCLPPCCFCSNLQEGDNEMNDPLTDSETCCQFFKTLICCCPCTVNHYLYALCGWRDQADPISMLCCAQGKVNMCPCNLCPSCCGFDLNANPWCHMESAQGMVLRNKANLVKRKEID